MSDDADAVPEPPRVAIPEQTVGGLTVEQQRDWALLKLRKIAMAQAAVTAARQKQYQAALDIAAAKAALGAARGRAEAADKEAFKAERALLKVNAEELTMPSMPTQEPKR